MIQLYNIIHIFIIYISNKWRIAAGLAIVALERQHVVVIEYYRSLKIKDVGTDLPEYVLQTLVFDREEH